MSLHQDSQVRRPRSLMLGVAGLALLALTACSSGSSSSSSGGAAAPANAAPLAGKWNFFRTALPGTCNDFEFAFFPMSLVHMSGNDVQVLIGFGDDVFRFTGAYNPTTRSLTVTGNDTMNGFTIQITSAVWQLDAALNELTGSMNVIRTEPGFAPCAISDKIDAFREDITNVHPLVQFAGDQVEFAFNLEILASDTPANVGEVGSGLAVFLPQRAGKLTLVFLDSLGDVVDAVQDITIVNNELILPAVTAAGDLQIISSELFHSPVANEVFGTIESFDTNPDGDGFETTLFLFYPII